MKSMFAVAAVLLATATGAQAQVYSNNFSNNTNGFTGATTVVTAPNGEKFIQLYNGDTNPGTGVTTLTINSAGYTNLSLSFSLYGIYTLDGNGPAGGGPDPFSVAANGTNLFTINIANYSGGGNTQSFNGTNYSGTGSYAARTGSVAGGDLGYGTGDAGGSTYLINYALPNGTTTITFTGASNQSAGDEFYGIDNVIVSGRLVGTAAVPEPASWAMMIAGFGLVGGTLRRRRATGALAAA